MANISAFVSPQYNKTAYSVDLQTTQLPAEEWTFSLYVNVVGIPCIIVFGIIGNILSLFVFLFTRMRSQTCSIYLSHLNISDTGFLFCLIPPWLAYIRVYILDTQGFCQFIIYATYIFSFSSTYTVVAFTIERYIVVYHPLKKSSMCTKTRALVVLLSLDVTACVLYSFALWMAGIDNSHGYDRCSQLQQYKDVLKIISSIDSVITFIIPSVSIIVLNCAILAKVYIFSKQMNVTLEDPTDFESDDNLHRVNTGTTSINSNRAKSCRRPPPNRPTTESTGRRRRRVYKMKTTRSLVLVSTSFLFLNMPSHLFRVYLVFSSFYEEAATFPPTVAIIQEIAMLIYYGNFAGNVFLYVLFSQSFRYGFLSLLKAIRMRIQQQTCRSCIRHCQQTLGAVPCLKQCVTTPHMTEMQTLSLDGTGDRGTGEQQQQQTH